MKNYFILILSVLLLGCNKGEHKSETIDSSENDSSIESFVVKPIDSLNYENWVKRNIEDVGFIYTPKDYDFTDNGTYGEISKQAQSNSQGVVVYKGEGDTAFFQIGITFKSGSSAKLPKLSNTEYKYISPTPTLTDIETVIKQNLIRGVKNLGNTIINSTPVKHYNFNGMFCAGFSFQSLSPQFSDTLNSTKYWINDNDRMHHISIAYTSNFYKRNKEDIEKTIDSFRITEIRQD